ncbi:MAG TPA: hypothetical protein VMV27_04835, partial [Candidatus Binataceae bacterium]|nr:hypothetical protein [Candidatus Binataceae bacterium]
IRPQVIILDIGLKAGGDLDALGLVRMIRAESPDSATILVCPANEPQRSEPFMDEGALECLVEPLAKEGFERVWHKLLTRFPELRPPELPRAKAARRPRGNSQ